jgi:Flp pilus assembly protein TadD
MEDLVRDHAPKELAREAFDVDGLRFRLARWRPDGNVGDWETGTLAELKRRPELEEGIHLLGLEAPRPGGAPVRKAFWLMSAPWQVSTFPVPRTHEMPQYWKQHLEGPLISRRTHKGLAVSSTLGCITREIERIDFYGIVATSEIDLPAGQYRVAMSVDDGSRLYIGDRLVMEDWGGHATRTRDGLVELGEGKHRLRVEFYQAASGHQLWLQFAPMNRAAKLAAASLGGSLPRLDSQIFEDEVKLLEPRPRPSTWPSYAHHLTRRGRFEESRVAYQTALAKDADDHACWFMQAHVLAYLGKAPEYAEHCNAMLDRFAATQDAVIAEATARACLLLRGHGDAQRLRPLLALSAETKATRTHWVCLTAGLAAYRAGEFEKALELLEEARPIFRTKSYPADAANEALIALCLKRLGRDASAAESARQAQAWFDEKAPILGVESLNHRGGAENWLICQIIFREARAEFPATPEK